MFNMMIAASALMPLTSRASPLTIGPNAKNVVLVHGLYADGSSWLDVIPYLQKAGLNAAAVQNPLTSLAEDVAATRRILAMQDGLSRFTSSRTKCLC